MFQQGKEVKLGAKFTIAAEDTNSINVGIQFYDWENGNELDEVIELWGFLSDAATGIGVVATAPDGDIAIGTDGAILGELVADKVFLFQSEADGDLDINIGETGADTFYLVLIMPDGRREVSEAITFVT